MSKPFNASSIQKTLFSANNLEVTFVDNHGTKQIVNLGPEARHQMILALLARAPLQQLQNHQKKGEPLFEPEHILNIQGVTALVLDKHKPILELILPHGMSVYLSFPLDGIKKFQIVLSELEKTLITSTIH